MLHQYSQSIILKSNYITLYHHISADMLDEEKPAFDVEDFSRDPQGDEHKTFEPNLVFETSNFYVKMQKNCQIDAEPNLTENPDSFQEYDDFRGDFIENLRDNNHYFSVKQKPVLKAES